MAPHVFSNRISIGFSPAYDRMERIQGYFPDKIESPVDLYSRFYKRTRGKDTGEIITKLYEVVRVLLKNPLTKENLKQAVRGNWFSMYSQVLEDDIKTWKKSLESTKKISKKYRESINDPSSYFMAKKHLTVSEIVLEEIIKNKEAAKRAIEEIDTNMVKNLSGEEFEMVRLGYFARLEPLTVPFLLIADRKRDIEFLSSYSILIDKYSHMVARSFPELWEKRTGLDKIKLKDNAFEVFLKTPRVL